MSWIELPSDDALRALASEILARPEYERLRPYRWGSSLLDALFSLDSWVKHLGGLQYAALLGGLVLVLALLVFHIVWSLRAASRATTAEEGRPRQAEARALDAEAHRLAQQGHFLDAAHQMQLACIDRLLRGGLLELHRHDPNRTLRKRLVATALSEDLKATFVSLLERFERRWFRDQTTDASDRVLYEEWRSLHERIASAAQVR
ncbi:MAG TPA: hypothetical protein VKE73_15955 [Myxococcota bacterium]|nr:hypothetical protein [Myxococcota bacterium]